MTTPALPAITKNVSQTQALSRSWGDCGNTANAVVNALRSAGFTIAAAPRQTFPGAGQNANAGGAALAGLLLAPVAQPTLFNVDIDGVHIFVLEKHPNGSSLLSQGYRGTYFPWWWQGLNRDALSLQVRTAIGTANADTVLETEQTDGPIGRDAGPVNQMRLTYGLGQDLGNNLTALANNLGALVQVGHWGGQRGVAQQATVAAWRALPFSPNDSTVIGTGGRAGEEAQNPIRVTVDTYTLTGLPGGGMASARTALGMPGETFFTAIVIRQAKAQIDQARYGAAVTAALG